MGGLAKFIILATFALFIVTRAWAVPQVPCFFIFGDSLVDNGNNNGILTLARANYLPYGIDFQQGVTGRFTNGRTTVDVLARLLGFRHFIPSYAASLRDEAVTGLNFASGASGIREETGDNLGEHYPMAAQVDQFRRVVQLMRRRNFRGDNTKLAAHLSKCIIYAGMGSNDYLNNYFMPTMYPTSRDYSPKTFARLLIQDYTRYLTQLYDLGARKLVVVGVGQIGCIPYELARYNNGNGGVDGKRCNEGINKAIMMYNNGLLQMVKRFNRKLRGARFIYVNTFDSSKDLITNAAAYGFQVVDRGCCGVGRNNGQITCLPLQVPCDNRRNHLFWDAFHPTDVANVLYAQKVYNSTSSTDVYPMNLQQLVMA